MKGILLCLGLLGLLGLLGCNSTKYDKEGNPVTIGKFRVRTYPIGAEIWSDGKKLAIHTPATLVLEQGSYHLKIQLPGAEAYEADITVVAGEAKERTFRIPRPPPARLSIVSDVHDADIRINGYRRGATPLANIVTRPGPVDITITTRDGQARSVRTHLGISEQKNVEVHFLQSSGGADTHITSAPKNLSTDPRGLLTLGLQPNGRVYDADGKSLGDTPIVKIVMEPGLHELLLRTEDGSKERKVTLSIDPGQHSVYRFMLKARDEVPEGRRIRTRTSTKTKKGSATKPKPKKAGRN